MSYQDTSEIEESCFELARTTKWVQKPIDAEEIKAQAGRFSEIAKEKVYEPLGINPALVARAVRYLAQAHGMPMGEDTQWFEHMLRAVLEVARPNSSLDERGQEFLKDMMDGIASSAEE
jgi:hypothetical protein